MDSKTHLSGLRRLVSLPTHDIDTYSEAHILLAGFYAANQDSRGQIVVSALEEKIDDVEVYFQRLCGVDEERFDVEKTRNSLLSAIRKLGIAFSEHGA